MAEQRDFEPSLRIKEVVALSPDGSQVAYVDDALGQFNVVVQPVSGAPPRRLTTYHDHTVSWLGWHPSGESLVFTAHRGGDERTQLYLLSLTGGEPQPLTDAPGAQFDLPFGCPFSPDSKRLLYTGNDRVPRERDILIRELNTDAVRRVHIDGASGTLAAGYWSPDGARLSAVDMRGGRSEHIAYVVSVEDGMAARLTDEVGPTYWPGS